MIATNRAVSWIAEGLPRAEDWEISSSPRCRGSTISKGAEVAVEPIRRASRGSLRFGFECAQAPSPRSISATRPGCFQAHFHCGGEQAQLDFEATHPRCRSSAISSSVDESCSGRTVWAEDVAARSRVPVSAASRSSCSMIPSASACVNLPSPCRCVSPSGPRALRKSACPASLRRASNR